MFPPLIKSIISHVIIHGISHVSIIIKLIRVYLYFCGGNIGLFFIINKTMAIQ